MGARSDIYNQKGKLLEGQNTTGTYRNGKQGKACSTLSHRAKGRLGPIHIGKFPWTEDISRETPYRNPGKQVHLADFCGSLRSTRHATAGASPVRETSSIIAWDG